MLIDLLRHGEVEGKPCFRGHTDEPLSDVGRQQILSALDNYKTDVVISSPLKRCAEIANEWSKQNNIPLTEKNDFMEINFGDWDGLTPDEIKITHEEELNNFWNNPVQNTPPNGETLLDFQTRVIRGWDSLIKDNKNKNILLVTHGGVIRMIIAHVLSIPLEKLLSIESPLASMSRIRISFDDQKNQYSSLVSHASNQVNEHD